MICLSQSSWIVGMVFFIPVRVGLTGFFHHVGVQSCVLFVGIDFYSC